jgi:hypothetical protein
MDAFSYAIGYLVALGVYLLICGGLGAYCSTQKGRSGIEGFCMGILLGPFGVIAAACLPEQLGIAAQQSATDNSEEAPSLRASDEEWEAWRIAQARRKLKGGS